MLPQKSSKYKRPKRKAVDTKIDDHLSLIFTIWREAATLLPKETRDLAIGFIRSRELGRLYGLADGFKNRQYETAWEHYTHNQFAALITKLPLPHTVFNFEKSPRAQALETFLESEIRCARTNRRFKRLSSLMGSRFFPLLEDMRSGAHRFFEAMGLGELDPGIEDFWDQAFGKCDFGGGSSIGVAGDETHIAAKLDAPEWTVTRTALHLAFEAIWSNDQLKVLLTDEVRGIHCFDKEKGWEAYLRKVRIVEGNKLAFVPKTAKTDRTIAVEPLLNTFLQKGVDSILRDNLLRLRVNLRDQGWNQELARQGSVSGKYSTLDLSSASDTLSRGLVKYLLPAKAFRELAGITSDTYTVSGKSAYYNKFTSMGNGICFPLESLVFVLAARACIRATNSEWKYAIYGDDIIVPTGAYNLLTSLLRFIGFVPNPRKSFREGPFRESCGADWYNGMDVRPVEWSTLPLGTAEIRIFHNSTNRNGFCRDFFREIRQTLIDSTPPELRLYRPDQGRVISRELERWEVMDANGAFDVPLDVFMASSSASWCRIQQRWRWKEVRYKPLSSSRPLPSLAWDHGRYLAFLRGSPGGRLVRRYSCKARITVR